MVGSTLVEVGQPNIPKPRAGIDGGGKAGQWTSRASKYLREVDRAYQSRRLANGATSRTLPFRMLGTKGIGAFLGRLVPIAGWGILAYDLHDNIWIFRGVQQGLQNYPNTYPTSQTGNLIYHICFVKGTLVYTTIGCKPIEALNIGESVYSFNEVNRRININKIINKLENRPSEVYSLRFNNETIEATSNHPFYVNGKGWIKVKDLKKLDNIKTIKGVNKLLDIDILQKEELVYNIEVEGDHNYFIGESHILVHNKN